MSENTVREGATHDESVVPPRGPSAPTVVFGLVLGVIAALVLGQELEVFEVDLMTSGVWLLLGSGALLVVWALVSMVGKRGDDPREGDDL